MRISVSRLRAATLFAVIVVFGLSMVAGPCGYSDPTPAPLRGVDPYPQPTSRPTVPVTPPTEDTDAAGESSPVLAKTDRAEPAEDTDTPSLPEDTGATGQMGTSMETEADPTVADTSPRDVSGMLLFVSQPGGAGSDYVFETETVEELLDKGMFAVEASPTHIVLRGTPVRDSVRCEWQGIARTPYQREEAIRFWLALGDDTALPSPAELERTFTAYVDRMGPSLREAMRATFIALARGGVTTEYFNLFCCVDYTVSEYLLGAGPTQVTLAYDTTEKAYSYDLYQTAHESGAFELEPLMSRDEHQESSIDQPIRDADRRLNDAVSGRDSVAFLVPLGAHNNIIVEAWQIIALWDLQEDDGGVLLAVRYNVPERHPKARQTLANLNSRFTAAASSDAFAGKRIVNVSGLNQYYRDMGAYDDITPDDDDDSTFIPAQPPPVPPCAGSTGVANTPDRSLVRDCENLLGL